MTFKRDSSRFVLASAPDASASTKLPCLAYINVPLSTYCKIRYRNFQRHRAVLHAIIRLVALMGSCWTIRWVKILTARHYNVSSATAECYQLLCLDHSPCCGMAPHSHSSQLALLQLYQYFTSVMQAAANVLSVTQILTVFASISLRNYTSVERYWE